MQTGDWSMLYLHLFSIVVKCELPLDCELVYRCGNKCAWKVIPWRLREALNVKSLTSTKQFPTRHFTLIVYIVRNPISFEKFNNFSYKNKQSLFWSQFPTQTVAPSYVIDNSRKNWNWALCHWKLPLKLRISRRISRVGNSQRLAHLKTFLIFLLERRKSVHGSAWARRRRKSGWISYEFSFYYNLCTASESWRGSYIVTAAVWQQKLARNLILRWN